MTTVCCVFVRGEYPYTVDYVRRLFAMVTRWMDRPFRFVCLTDQPKAMPEGVQAVPVKKLAGFAPWTKLELFNPVRQWSGRVLYLDLDTLIVAPLAPILDYPSRFALTADPVGKTGRDSFKRLIVRRFNSSVMVWDGGTQTELYTEWTPDISTIYSGDQDWTGWRAKTAGAMPRIWFPRISECRDGVPEAAKVVLVKVPKNHIAVDEIPWFAPLWGAA